MNSFCLYKTRENFLMQTIMYMGWNIMFICKRYENQSYRSQTLIRNNKQKKIYAYVGHWNHWQTFSVSFKLGWFLSINLSTAPYRIDQAVLSFMHTSFSTQILQTTNPTKSTTSTTACSCLNKSIMQLTDRFLCQRLLWTYLSFHYLSITKTKLSTDNPTRC